MRTTASSWAAASGVELASHPMAMPRRLAGPVAHAVSAVSTHCTMAPLRPTPK
jgi:hypothetical protein